MTDLDFQIFDTDNHFYEATDAFTRHMDPKMAPRAMQWTELDGKPTLLVGGKVNHFFASPTCDPIWKAGSLREIMRGNNPKKLDFLEVAMEYEPAKPDYKNRDARLKKMDEQGIEGIFSFTSLANGMERELDQSDPEACIAAFEAFNRWLDEDWGFHYQERIFAAPYITMIDPDAAVRELEWTLLRGARVLQVRAGPIPTRDGFCSPGDRKFDPFWARVNEAGIVIGYHGGVGRYQDYLSDWGESSMFDFQDSTFNEVVGFHGQRNISDNIAALICHGVFERFSRVRVATVESGSDWVAPLLKELGRVSRMLPKGFAKDPVETFHRHVSVSCTPFTISEPGDMLELRDTIGVENIVMGSDYPHAEGLADPKDLVKELDGFSDQEIQMVLRENGLALVQPPAF
jgi:predicted TIM-barrel fold metal-dependent hydrolase